jgi:glycosyltransferase involved in cell wall biosynthesis
MAMAIPRITALINAYNYGRFVGEAIESVLAQDVARSEMEVLVIDDGSTDDTAAQVAKFGDRVRYVRKENGGQASALNVGFALARGEIISLLDADDVWMPQKVQRVVEVLEKHPEAGMVYHAALIWEMDQGACYEDTHLRSISGNIASSLADLLQYRGCNTSGLTFRRPALEGLLPIPERLRLYADSYLMYLIIFLTPVVMVDEYLLKYRVHSQNNATLQDADSGRRQRRAEAIQAAVEEIETWLRAQGHDLARPEIAAFMTRHRLWEQSVRFAVRGAGRLEFARWLHQNQELYGRFWSTPQKVRQQLLALGALLVGYDGYNAIRNAYRKAAGILHFEPTLTPQRKPRVN